MEPNRLGANSLLDLVVFGRGTGKNIVEKCKSNGLRTEDIEKITSPDEKGFQKVLT